MGGRPSKGGSMDGGSKGGGSGMDGKRGWPLGTGTGIVGTDCSTGHNSKCAKTLCCGVATKDTTIQPASTATTDITVCNLYTLSTYVDTADANKKYTFKCT